MVKFGLTVLYLFGLPVNFFGVPVFYFFGLPDSALLTSSKQNNDMGAP